MNKKIICALLAVMLLTACSGTAENKDDPVNSSAESGTVITAGPTESSQNDPEESTAADTEKEAETVGVTYPPIPEGGVPEIPDSSVKYSDEKVLVVVDTEGTSYANGKPVSPDEAEDIINQAMADKRNEATTSDGTVNSNDPSPDKPDVTSKNPDKTTTVKSTETEVTVPDITYPEDTTRPEGTVFIDDTVDDDLYSLAKYVSTGKTDLAITDITVYSGSRPGVVGVDAFKPGDTVIVNLWCNTVARFDSVLYIVPEEAEHKDSYLSEDCLMEYELFPAFEAGKGQIAFEVELPDRVQAGVYEFRFVCGTEEGYIPFHIG